LCEILAECGGVSWLPGANFKSSEFFVTEEALYVLLARNPVTNFWSVYVGEAWLTGFRDRVRCSFAVNKGIGWPTFLKARNEDRRAFVFNRPLSHVRYLIAELKLMSVIKHIHPELCLNQDFRTNKAMADHPQFEVKLGNMWARLRGENNFDDLSPLELAMKEIKRILRHFRSKEDRGDF